MTLLETLIFTQIGSIGHAMCLFTTRLFVPHNIMARQNIRLSTKALKEKTEAGCGRPVITFLVAQLYEMGTR